MTSVLTAIMATCLATGGLFIAAMCTASSVNRNRLILNLVLGIVGAIFLNFIMLVIALLTWSFRDSRMVFASSLIMCAVSGAYIVFALLAIIIPEVTDREDYILAALRLYLEMVRLFLYILILLGNKK